MFILSIYVPSSECENQSNLGVDFLEMGKNGLFVAKVGKKTADNLQLHLHDSLHIFIGVKK